MIDAQIVVHDPDIRNAVLKMMEHVVIATPTEWVDAHGETHQYSGMMVKAFLLDAVRRITVGDFCAAADKMEAGE